MDRRRWPLLAAWKRCCAHKARAGRGTCAASAVPRRGNPRVGVTLSLALVNRSDEVRRWSAERPREPNDDAESGRLQATLQLADVGTVNLRAMRQFFLR